MNFETLYRELEANGSEQTRKTYRRHGAPEPMFGVSFAVLGKLKKSVVSPGKKKGVNQEIAQQLWDTKNTDARTLALMIIDPDVLTETEAENWIKEINYQALADYFAQAVAKTPFAEKKLHKWIKSKDEYIRRTGYSLLNSLLKGGKNFDERDLDMYMEKIEKELQSSANWAKEAMNTSLVAIGSVNETLRARVIEIANRIGPVEIDYGDTHCQTIVVEEYLERIYARKKTMKF